MGRSGKLSSSPPAGGACSCHEGTARRALAGPCSKNSTCFWADRLGYPFALAFVRLVRVGLLVDLRHMRHSHCELTCTGAVLSFGFKLERGACRNADSQSSSTGPHWSTFVLCWTAPKNVECTGNEAKGLVECNSRVRASGLPSTTCA